MAVKAKGKSKEKSIDEDLIRLPEGNDHIHGCGHPVRAVVLCDDPLAFTDSEWTEWAQEHAETMESTVGDRMKCKCYFCYAKERGILGAFKGMHESVQKTCPHGDEVNSEGITPCHKCAKEACDAKERMETKARNSQRQRNGLPPEIQTRSEENGLGFHATLSKALEVAKADHTIWKISFSVGAPEESVRLVRRTVGEMPEGRLYEWVLERLEDSVDEEFAKRAGCEDMWHRPFASGKWKKYERCPTCKEEKSIRFRQECPHGKKVDAETGIIMCKPCTQVLKQPTLAHSCSDVCMNPKCVELRRVRGNQGHIHGCGHPVQAIVIDNNFVSVECWMEYNDDHEERVSEGESCLCIDCYEKEESLKIRRRPVTKKAKGLVQSLSGVHHRKKKPLKHIKGVPQ